MFQRPRDQVGEGLIDDCVAAALSRGHPVRARHPAYTERPPPGRVHTAERRRVPFGRRIHPVDDVRPGDPPAVCVVAATFTKRT
jgi:hypothetical protein